MLIIYQIHEDFTFMFAHGEEKIILLRFFSLFLLLLLGRDVIDENEIEFLWMSCK